MDILSTIVCGLVSHRPTSLFPHQLNAKIACVSHRLTNPCPHLSLQLNAKIAFVSHRLKSPWTTLLVCDHWSHQYDLVIPYHSS